MNVFPACLTHKALTQQRKWRQTIRVFRHWTQEAFMVSKNYSSTLRENGVDE